MLPRSDFLCCFAGLCRPKQTMGVCAVASESNDQRRVSKAASVLLFYGFLSLFRIVSSLALLKWTSSSFILHS
jgi:hypothetical protein